MGATSRTLGQQPRQQRDGNMAVTPAAQALAQVDPNGGLDSAGAPASGYDALAESRKRLAAAAAGRRSLFNEMPGAVAPQAVLGAT